MEQYKKEITVFSITEDSRSQYIPFIDKGFIVHVPLITFNNRDFNMSIHNGKLLFHIGCRRIPLDMLKEEYDILVGITPSTYIIKNVKSIATKKSISKSPVISESDDYYIVKTLKAYPKATHYVEDVTHSVVSKVKERTGYSSGMFYDGYNMGSKKYVTEHMKDLIELGDAINKFLEEGLKE